LNRPRAREAGVRFGDLPTGPRNLITDVPGVKVGHSTIIRGSGALKPGTGPVRTGVTAFILSEGTIYLRLVKVADFYSTGCAGLVGVLQIR